jgi:hypothetical protein
VRSGDDNSLQPRFAGGEGGIRTLGTGVSPYNGLANRRIRPLCHLSSARTSLIFRQTRAASDMQCRDPRSDITPPLQRPASVNPYRMSVALEKARFKSEPLSIIGLSVRNGSSCAYPTQCISSIDARLWVLYWLRNSVRIVTQVVPTPHNASLQLTHTFGFSIGCATPYESSLKRALQEFADAFTAGHRSLCCLSLFVIRNTKCYSANFYRESWKMLLPQRGEG